MGKPKIAPIDAPQRVRVEVDLPITRRRRVHEIVNCDGEVLSHHQTVGGLFSWLHEHDHHEIVIVDGDANYLVNFSVPPWQS